MSEAARILAEEILTIPMRGGLPKPSDWMFLTLRARRVAESPDVAEQDLGETVLNTPTRNGCPIPNGWDKLIVKARRFLLDRVSEKVGSK